MMTATILPVPTILNILNDNDSYTEDENFQGPARAKKRRLDHLSWEEKIQRKKLKNRVAAQTSRDRKKAKLEQMESAIQQLFTKNETLLEECEKLRQANERLQADNADLQQRLQVCTIQEHATMPMPMPDCRVRARERINRIPPSTERNERGHSSGIGEGPQGGSVPENNVGLPSLPDLLDELESDAVDFNALEQLTQTLLEDIARDLESAAEKAADQEPAAGTENIPRKMVGSPSEQLESGGDEMLEEETSVEQNISEYLLLHHNYAKTQPKITRSTNTSRQLKTIRPKPDTTTKNSTAAKCKLPVKNTSSLFEMPKIASNCEVVYGSIDDNSNTFTILVNEDSIPLNEVVLDEKLSLQNNSTVVADVSNLLSVPVCSEGSLSPRSDLGYESVDSPLSASDLDTWDSSVTELFPSLF